MNEAGENDRSGIAPDNHGATDPAAYLSTIVGENLRRLRRRQGYSLERLARLSGVSRAMLGQIETGKSVPTIALLWKVAHALGIGLAHLLTDAEDGSVAVLRKSDAKLLSGQNGRYVMRALFPFEGERSVEFYEVRIAPLHREPAAAYAPGTRQNVIVAQGAVEITVEGEKPIILAEGDAALFDADVQHAYRNLSGEAALLYLVVILGSPPLGRAR